MKRSGFPRIKKVCAAAVMLAVGLAATDAFAQWKKIANFHQPVNCVYILDSGKISNYIGFVGTDATLAQYPNNDERPEIWRTTDGGKTWEVVYKGNFPILNVNQIFFKDDFTGWANAFHLGRGALLKTSNGGNTWDELAFPDFASNEIGFYYNSKTNILVQSRDVYTSILSSDGGTTWQYYGAAFNSGYAFVDSYNGIVASINDNDILTTKHNYNRTTDGGLTWQEIQFQEETWQPLAYYSSYYVLAEYALWGNSKLPNPNNNIVYKSEDLGLTWSQIYKFPSSMIGTLGSDSRALYAQAGHSSNLDPANPLIPLGFMVSTDQGISWYSICGPDNFWKTRFYVSDYGIWAGDSIGGLWFNNTGIGSNSTPHFFSDKKSFLGLGCNPSIDSVITFTFFDSCNGIQAKLVSASITGSNNFSFSSPSAIPRTIHPDDSLMVSYNPVSQASDTAALHLRFHLGWKDFDTTIQLFGSGRIPKADVKFIPTLSSYSAQVGSVVDLFIKPDKAISGRGLDSISFSISYNADLLNSVGSTFTTGIAGALISVGAEEPSPSVPLPEYREREVVVRGVNLSL
ncbi:MAG: hypothetical protein ABI778_11625, partial [Ignavibacteriota bacterium]